MGFHLALFTLILGDLERPNEDVLPISGIVAHFLRSHSGSLYSNSLSSFGFSGDVCLIMFEILY